jgi:hypothetical protein
MEDKNVLIQTDTVVSDEVTTPSQLQTISDTRSNEWRSCCFLIDKRLLAYFANFLLTLILVSFCIFQLNQEGLNSERFTLFISLLTGSVNLWMPNPKIT